MYMPKPGHNYFADRLGLCRPGPGWGLVVERRTKVGKKTSVPYGSKMAPISLLQGSPAILPQQDFSVHSRSGSQLTA